jgi:hypothetical protein
MGTEHRTPEKVQVRVHRPQVRHGRVRFSWDQDVANPLQRVNAWWVHYHGVPVHRMDRRLLTEVLLSLQLPLWAAQGRSVVVELAEPVGEVTLDFWRAYHDAGHVTFRGPVDDCRRYRPGRPAPRRRLGRAVPVKQVAVSFGGGKDSTLAHAALLERRRAGDVLLLHVVHPFHHSPSVRRHVTARSLRTIVWPAKRRTGSPVQLVSTDFMAQLRQDVPGPRPHVNLYAGAMLPALVHHGTTAVTYSRTALGFRVTHAPDGTPRFSNPGGRPERLRHLRRYLTDTIGLPLHVESTHYAIGEYASFGTVFHEYPDRFQRMVMCTQSRRHERFCHQCRKCLEFALLSLSYGHVAPDLDYDAVLTHPRVRRIVEVARRRPRSGEGPAPYHRRLGTASHFTTWCHALHRIDPDADDLPLGPRAREVLRVLVATWGQPYPAVQRLDTHAVSAAGPLGREVADVTARHFPVVDPDRLPEDETVLMVGNRRATFDHRAVMPTPALDAWAHRWDVPDVDGARVVGPVT